MKKNIEKLKKNIKKANNILLINHIKMDMDAFWSLSAMYDILKQLWKNVKAINDEALLEKFFFIWYNNIIEPNLDLKKFNPDLIISFDAASLDQLWYSYSNNKSIFENTDFFVIDHHRTNPWYWKVNIIDSKSSSTCELTYTIIKEMKFKKYITPKIATSLLSWIYTDTNIFYNSNTTKKTHLIAWKLIELWADFRKPYYEFYMKKTFSWSKLWWEILANYMKTTEKWKIIYACVDKNVFEKTNSNQNQLTWLISEFFSNIEWVEICFLSYEDDNNKVKTSFRSNNNYDVSKICQSFWWWWHKQAAWFTSEKSLKEVKKEILKQLKKDLKLL